MPQPSPRVAAFAQSWIRDMTRLAVEYKAINCGQGFPDFPPPPELTAALEKVSAAGAHQYSNTWGTVTLRQAIARRVERSWGTAVDSDTQITVTCGVTEGIIVALQAILAPGDEALVLEPAHENYHPATLMAGGTARWVALRPPEFRLDADALRAACGPRTRAIILNTPHNPSGRVFNLDELTALANLCQERDLWLVTDEIYEDIVYDGLRHIPPATLPGMRERTITVSGVGKTFAATGWRLGYVIAPPVITDAVRKWHDYTTICAPTPLQEAAAIALDTLGPAFYTDLRSGYTRRRDRVMAMVSGAGLTPVKKPEGAYYLMVDISSLGFPDGRAAVEWMVKTVGVATVPGASFYGGTPELGRQQLRFAFCKQDATLDEAERRLARMAALRATR